MTCCSNKTEGLHDSTRERHSSYVANFQRNEMAGADVSFGHLVRLNVLPQTFLGGFLKDAMYMPVMVTTLPDLASMIRVEVATIFFDLL
jgi:hypothetical protein